MHIATIATGCRRRGRSWQSSTRSCVGRQFGDAVAFAWPAAHLSGEVEV